MFVSNTVNLIRNAIAKVVMFLDTAYRTNPTFTLIGAGAFLVLLIALLIIAGSAGKSRPEKKTQNDTFGFETPYAEEKTPQPKADKAKKEKKNSDFNSIMPEFGKKVEPQSVCESKVEPQPEPQVEPQAFVEPQPEPQVESQVFVEPQPEPQPLPESYTSRSGKVYTREELENLIK